jgi:two-component system, NtrC family, response regulator AtoC
VSGGDSPLDAILGDSPAIVEFRDSIAALALRVSGLAKPPPVLLLGEDGTGKALAARALHWAGPRSEGPFMRAAITIPELMDVELFGHVRHSGMRPEERVGLCQLAHGGTLLIDEVFPLLGGGILNAVSSAIETGSVRRLGSAMKEPADFWLIASSSASLDTPGPWRSLRDVFEPLGASVLTVPALRDRGTDIVLLAEHLLSRHCRWENVPPKTLTPEAKAELLRFHWPGNVRQLASVIERAALSVRGASIGADDIGVLS